MTPEFRPTDVAVTAAVVASLVAGSQTDFSDVRLAVQPRAPAFSIWIAIYFLLLLSDPPADAAVPLVASLVLTVVWARTVTVSASTSASVLWASTLGAWVALYVAGESPLWPTRLALGVYAGWLGVASVLGLALARPEWDHPTTLWAGVAAVVVASASLGEWTPLVAVGWALVWR